MKLLVSPVPAGWSRMTCIRRGAMSHRARLIDGSPYQMTN